MSLWGGRFEGRSDPRFKAFNDSLRFDVRLVHDDIAGSVAWARAIARAGVITQAEAARIVTALHEIGDGAANDRAAILASGAEDVHSWVEAQLIKRVGDLGKKLHTGRSRNDQVATDLRLFVRREGRRLVREVRGVQEALVALAEREIGTAFPGYTHLQRAQPITFAHWCLAYFEMLDRDGARLTDALGRANACPLGSGALAGTPYRIDRGALARDLGFDAPTANSLDAVSDRDFVAELLGAGALIAVHLSRLAEDLVVYSTQEFGLVEMDDSVASGSSLMPQKKNPDALELVRGKCGRILGAHVAVLTTLKGLPLAYNKDMQEDKEALFDAIDTLSMCLGVVVPVLSTLRVKREACGSAAAGGYSTATELADYLVARGVPFRTAHEMVGAIVRHAITQRKELRDLSLGEFQSFDRGIDRDVYEWLTVESAVRRRALPGGPGDAKNALDQARRRLGAAAPSSTSPTPGAGTTARIN